MLIKVTRGSSPSGICRYVLDPAKQHKENQADLERSGNMHGLIICQNIPGNTAEDLARHIQQLAKLNTRVEKTVAHYSISLPQEDNEKVDLRMMRRISRALLQQLGHKRSPFFAVEHHDTIHKHWHIVAGTVGFDGNWVTSSFDRYQARTTEKLLEKTFDLKRTEHQNITPAKNLATGEYRLKRRTGRLLPKERIWRAIDECAELANSLAKFTLLMRFKHPDVSIQFKEQDGRIVGISFGVEGIAFAGRSLGRAYSLKGLETYHGIRRETTPEATLREILGLPAQDCEQLYLDLQKATQREIRNQPQQLQP